MSLQTAAEAVRQKGRGEDTMLIHMTPGEVNGLQQLAMAYGGSLTVNPETGLPEASFLKSLLPTLLGVGLAATGIGAPMAGLIVGGIQTARTGDLGQGILAGLGAYGGADLAGAFGSQGAVQGAGATTTQQAAQRATQASMVSPAGAAGTGGLAGIPGYSTASTGAFSPMASQAAPTGFEIAKAGGFAPATTTAGRLSQMGTGVSNVLSSGADGTAARSAVMESLGGTSGAIKTGLAAASGPLAYVPPAQTIEPEEYNYDGPYLPTERKVRFPTADRDPMDSSEFQFFDVVNPAPGFQPMGSSASAQPVTAGSQVMTDVINQARTDLSGEAKFAGIPVSLATNPDRMREYQANPNLYSFAEGGAAEATMPPAGYQAGMEAEFDYGFRPMAAQVPEIQQQAAQENALVQARLGNDGGGSDYYGPGVPFNQTNNQLPPEVRSNLVDRIASMNMAQQQRAAAAAAIAAGANPSNDFSGNEGGGGFMSTSEGHSMGAAANPDRNDGGYGLRAGGGLNMDNGGFVVDAHTVSEIGNGSSDAGHEMLARLGGEPIKGPGDGVSDSIKANIGGVQEARVAKDESYLSREDVKALGGGDLKKGEKMLYQLMAKAHESRKQKGRGQATGLDKLISRMA